jgi:hypothetical protein
MKSSISRASDSKLAQSALFVQLAQALLEAAGTPAEKSATPTLIPIKEPERLLAAGIEYPKTYWGWVGVYRERHNRGLARAFVKSGRRVLVDVQAYLEAMRAQHASTNGQAR